MAYPSSFTPYTYIQCPCHDSTSQARAADDAHHAPSPTRGDGAGAGREDDGDDGAFDPRAPRSNYSLYPLEYLLYCDVCHQIRCPRCISEEIVNVYCPNCLFEVASSSLKTEGNRCTRSCFQCPICIGPLAVQSLESAPDQASLLSADSGGAGAGGGPSGPWILACSYCNWNSAEIGVKFDKPQGISAQLAKLRHGHGHGHGHGGIGVGDDLPPHHHHSSSRHASMMVAISSAGGDDSHSPTNSSGRGGDATAAGPQTARARFAALKAFYQSQLAASNPSAGLPAAMSDYGFNSPGTLSRIMSLYSGGGGGGIGGLKQKSRASTMREAATAGEGLRVRDFSSRRDDDDEAALARLRRDGWDGTVGREQAQWQADSEGEGTGAGPRFTDELWPVPYLLRSKRSKRCPVCRHIISKPESKVGNTRWRIRLVANNYIPSISIKLLNSNASLIASPTTTSPPPLPPKPRATTTGSTSNDTSNNHLLKPLQPVQYLLTFKNPIFEEVRVTLATPATTPGRFASRVTLLCPQFSIGANMEDMDIDDVLLKDANTNTNTNTNTTSSSSRGGRPGSLVGVGAGATTSGGGEGAEGAGEGEGEAPAAHGKIWERGRNWVSVVVEVIPASLRIEPPPVILRKPGDPEPDLGPLREDEDVLEVPVFVRLEWEGEVAHDQVVGIGTTAGGGKGGADKDAKEKKELAYWCALGIGRISQE